MRLPAATGLALAAALALSLAPADPAASSHGGGGFGGTPSGNFDHVDTWPPGESEHAAWVDEDGQRVWARPGETAFLSFPRGIPARTSTRIELADGRVVGELVVGSGGVFKLTTPASGKYSNDFFVSYLDERARRVTLRSGRLVSKDPESQPAITSPYDPIDVMMVVDTSGSMVWNDPDGRRGDALNILYRLSRVGDRIGTIGFAGSSKVLSPFTSITGGDQAKALGVEAAAAVTSDGATNYDDAFSRAASQLNQAGNLSRRKVVVFLSDGGHNTPTLQYQNSHQTLTHNSTGKAWPVCSIQLGSDLSSRDVNRLKRIAQSTGGVFVKAPDADSLVDAFNRCRGITACEHTIDRDVRVMSRGEIVRTPAGVPLNRRLATFRVSGGANRHTVNLIAPSGNTYSASSLIPGITYKTGRNWATYEVQNPRAGGWTVEVRATGVAQRETDTVRSQATVDRCGPTTRLVYPD